MSMTPQEIVSELDNHIVGQPAAKRAVAIALRNRWRRLQLTGNLREEVLPKNILMIGPTGVGKTEIARRLAKLAGAQLLAKGIPGGGTGARPDQRIEHAFFGGELGAGLHVLALALTGLRDRDFDEIADDLLDVAADIADLRKLGGLDLDERRAGKFRQPPCDFGLADAGWPDHQDVFRQHFFAQVAGELQPPPAVAQRDRDGALGVGLADDEAVEFGDDFAGRKVGHWL